MGLLRFCQIFDKLLIETEGQLFGYNEPLDELNQDSLKICLPLSHSPAISRSGHYNELGGHMGATETYIIAKGFYYWPGMLDWVSALTADSITYQNNRPKPKDRDEVPLADWQNNTIPFRAVH